MESPGRGAGVGEWGAREPGEGEGSGPEAAAAWAWGRDGDPGKRLRSCGGAGSGCEWVTRSAPPGGAGTAAGLAPSSRVDPQKRGELSAHGSPRGQSQLGGEVRSSEGGRSACWRLPRGFPGARRRLSVLLECRALPLFCRAEGSGEKTNCQPKFSQRREEARNCRERRAECLPEDATSGNAFIELSLRDVPSSGFSDSLSDLNTH